MTAGLCQVVATNPMEIVKIQLQLAGARLAPGEARPTAMDVVRKLGLKGMYKGTAATLARDVPFSFIFFPLVAAVKGLATPLADGTAPFYAVFGSGVVAGAVAAAAVTPMDVVKTRLQVIPKPGDRVYSGMLDCYRYLKCIHLKDNE
jgi:Mitochondrial carrier protein